MSSGLHKCCEVCTAFEIEIAHSRVQSLKEAEQWLEDTFSIEVKDKNHIEFDFLLKGQIYEEKLYEYKIKEADDSCRTFYIDKELGFECQCNLPPSYKDIISGLHRKIGA